MPGPSRRKRTHKGIGQNKTIRNGFTRVKPVDQVHEDLSKPETIQALSHQEVNIDLPGLGQHYCMECSRHFMSETHMTEHRKSKVHKRRIKQLREVPYSIQEAEAAGGLSTDNGKGRKSLLAPPGPVLLESVNPTTTAATTTKDGDAVMA